MSERTRNKAIDDIYSALGVMSFSGQAGERQPMPSTRPKKSPAQTQTSALPKQSRKRIPQHVVPFGNATRPTGSGDGRTQASRTTDLEAADPARRSRRRDPRPSEGSSQDRDGTVSKDVVQYQTQKKMDIAKKSSKRAQSERASKDVFNPTFHTKEKAESGSKSKATRRKEGKGKDVGVEVIESELEQNVEDAEIKPVETMTVTTDSGLVLQEQIEESNFRRKRDQTLPNLKQEDQSLRYQDSRSHPWLSVRDEPSNPRYYELLKDFKKELDYYRSIERGHGIFRGRVSDPEQKTTLAEAIIFKGSCNDMCPMHERVTRLLEKDIDRCEKVDGFPLERMMVKRFQRSSAGKLPPLPSEVRTPATLKRSTIYLLDTVLNDCSFHDAHRFVWDRTRSIRTDFSYYSPTEWDTLELCTVVYCYERIARFHLMALHYFAHHPDEKPDSFSRVQEIEQLVATVVTLKAMYEVCTSRSLYIPTFPQFLALWGIVFGHQGNVSAQLAAHAASKPKDMNLLVLTGILNQVVHNLVPTPGPIIGPRAVLQNSICAKTAAELSTGNVPTVIALFLEYSFNKIRETALEHLRDAIATNRMTKKDATPYFLAEYLYFDDVSEMIRWLEHVSPPIEWRQDDIGQEKWADFDYHAHISVNQSLVEVPRFPMLANVTKNITSIDPEGFENHVEPMQTPVKKIETPISLSIDGHPTNIIRISNTDSAVGEIWSDSDTEQSETDIDRSSIQAKVVDLGTVDKAPVGSSEPQQIREAATHLDFLDALMVDVQDSIESPVDFSGPTNDAVRPPLFDPAASLFQPAFPQPTLSFSEPPPLPKPLSEPIFTAAEDSIRQIRVDAPSISLEQKPSLSVVQEHIEPEAQPIKATPFEENVTQAFTEQVALPETARPPELQESSIDDESSETRDDDPSGVVQQLPEIIHADTRPVETKTKLEAVAESSTNKEPPLTREEKLKIWKEMTLLMSRRGPKARVKSRRVGRRQSPYPSSSSSSVTDLGETARQGEEGGLGEPEPSSTKKASVSLKPQPLSAKQLYDAEFDDSLMLAETRLASASINLHDSRSNLTSAKSVRHSPVPRPSSKSGVAALRSLPRGGEWLDQTASTYWKRLAAGVDDEALGLDRPPVEKSRRRYKGSPV